MRKTLILILFFGGFLGTAQDPYSCEGLDTLETWQGVRYCLIQSYPEAQSPSKGSKVFVYYKGYFENGVVFDSTQRPKEPFTFRHQKLEVIRGWDAVFPQLHAGDKVRIFVPWKLAYGRHGNPPIIPPKANLIFDIEVLDIFR